MAETRVIHGHTVMFEENAHEGIRYLRDDLSAKEAEVIFDQAKAQNSAQFEDDNDRDFTLWHEGDKYILVRR